MMPTFASRPGVMMPGQLGPISRAPARADFALHAHLVERRDALGDAHDERRSPRRRPRGRRRPRTRRARKSSSCSRRSSRRRRPRCRRREPSTSRAAACRASTPADDVRAVLAARERVEARPRRPVMPWTKSRVFRSTRMLMRTASTIRRAAVVPCLSRGVMSSPLFARIARPFSTFVPSSRTTSGRPRARPPSWRRPRPRAITSQRMIPPKMFTRMPWTVGSSRMIRNAVVTCSAVAPPPTSRKFAGSPPWSFTMSMVAIARPAPFTRHPMLPSSFTYERPASLRPNLASAPPRWGPAPPRAPSGGTGRCRRCSSCRRGTRPCRPSS